MMPSTINDLSTVAVFASAPGMAAVDQPNSRSGSGDTQAEVEVEANGDGDDEVVNAADADTKAKDTANKETSEEAVGEEGPITFSDPPKSITVEITTAKKDGELNVKQIVVSITPDGQLLSKQNSNAKRTATTKRKAPSSSVVNTPTNQVRPKCNHEGCNNQVVKGGVCWRHGAKPTRKICSVEGCTNRAKK
mmetsp:Transcript_4188/g.7441  ORF Transcript_4188/g.7441 Transcript_4188/m.7441 type:complete len:192 (+) Transcript_4188:171-746(+)